MKENWIILLKIVNIIFIIYCYYVVYNIYMNEIKIQKIEENFEIEYNQCENNIFKANFKIKNITNYNQNFNKIVDIKNLEYVRMKITKLYSIIEEKAKNILEAILVQKVSLLYIFLMVFQDDIIMILNMGIF